MGVQKGAGVDDGNIARANNVSACAGKCEGAGIICDNTPNARRKLVGNAIFKIHVRMEAQHAKNLRWSHFSDDPTIFSSILNGKGLA